MPTAVHERNRRLARWAPIALFGGLAVLGSLVSWALVIGPWRTAREAASWAATSAVVVESRVEREVIDGDRRHRPVVVYRYAAGGGTHESGEYDPSGPRPPEPYASAARRVVDAHPPGRRLTAYVDPDDPARAVLEREWSAGPLWAVLVLPAAGIAGLVGVAWAAARRRGPWA